MNQFCLLLYMASLLDCHGCRTNMRLVRPKQNIYPMPLATESNTRQFEVLKSPLTPENCIDLRRNEVQSLSCIAFGRNAFSQSLPLTT